MRDAFGRLGSRTAAVQAKDVVASGYAAPGHGAMDFQLVLRLHHDPPEPVPVIAQDLTADDARVHDFLAGHALKAGHEPIGRTRGPGRTRADGLPR